MFVSRIASGLRVAAIACIAMAAAMISPARAQDSAQSNATFWLQERARAEHVRPAQGFRQAPRVRRLVPNKRLARPTLWRRPAAHPSEEARRPAPVTPTTAPAPTATPELARPAPAQPTPAEANPALPATDAPAMADGTQPGLDAAPKPAPPQAAAAPTPPEQAAAPPAQPAAKGAVVVIGDNLGSMLAQGLVGAEADDDGSGGLGVEIVRKTHDSSGLVRDDFYDWQKNLREILAAPTTYAAVVMMIGSNDHQELRDAAGGYPALTPRWREIYTERVNGMLAQLKAKGAPFFWVGLPIMRGERFSNDNQQLNDIYRAQVEAAGGRYVDIWDAFADEKGRYSVFGPDVNGQIVKLRTSDGVHFTKAGQRKLAYFAEQAMRGVLDRAKPAPDAAIAALPPASGQAPTPGAPAAAAPGPAAPGPAVPGPAAPGPAAPAAPHPAPIAAPAPPPKPEFGPIVPLTAPPLALNGELLGPANAQAGSQQARAVLAPELASGRTTPAPKGRADDFAWPPR